MFGPHIDHCLLAAPPLISSRLVTYFISGNVSLCSGGEFRELCRSPERDYVRFGRSRRELRRRWGGFKTQTGV
jgi:hypothetical protein